MTSPIAELRMRSRPVSESGPNGLYAAYVVDAEDFHALADLALAESSDGLQRVQMMDYEDDTGTNKLEALIARDEWVNNLRAALARLSE